MWFNSLLASWESGRSRSPRPQPRPARRGTSLVLEHLEDRTLPSNYSAASVNALISDINDSNRHGGSNTIILTAPTTSPYVLTDLSSKNGAAGLPVIAANDHLTILGNGDTIERSTAAPAFRLLEVASGASLTLANLTLENGVAITSPDGAAEGGGILNYGTLLLNGMTVANNVADGRLLTDPHDAFGGGIWSNGSLTLENGTLLENNAAVGPAAVNWHARGGALFVAGGTVHITNTTITNNSAQAGYFYSPGGYGGGIYVAYGATVYLDPFTVLNTINNTDSSGPNGPTANIDGTYILLP